MDTRRAGLAMAVAALVGVGGLLAACTDDGDAADPTTTTDGTTTTTEVEVTDVVSLGEAVGCEDVDPRPGAPVYPGGAGEPAIQGDLESATCTVEGLDVAYLIHVDDPADTDALVGYFDQGEGPFPCPPDDDPATWDESRLYVVAGDGWVATTFDPAWAEEIAARTDGAETDFSPPQYPPASYALGGYRSCATTLGPAADLGGPLPLLVDAARCAGVEDHEAGLPVEIERSLICLDEEGRRITALHHTPDPVARDAVVAAYEAPGDAPDPNAAAPCPFESEDQTESRRELWVVAGDDWVAATHSDVIATLMPEVGGGAVTDGSPVVNPPVGPDRLDLECTLPSRVPPG